MNKKDKKSFSNPRTLRTLFLKINRDDKLGQLIFNVVDKWYDAKHSSFTKSEVLFVNSINISCCPYCRSKKYKKNGFRKDGTKCYRCNTCYKKFNPLTGSIFDSRKIPISEWIEFLIHLFQYQSIKVSSLDNRNTYSTGRYWINKAFEILKDYQKSIILKSTFWIDETYLKLMPKNMKRDQGGKLLRGLSCNNFCIMTLTDGFNTILIADGVAKPSKKRIKN